MLSKIKLGKNLIFMVSIPKNSIMLYKAQVIVIIPEIKLDIFTKANKISVGIEIAPLGLQNIIIFSINNNKTKLAANTNNLEIKKGIIFSLIAKTKQKPNIIKVKLPHPLLS